VLYKLSFARVYERNVDGLHGFVSHKPAVFCMITFIAVLSMAYEDLGPGMAGRTSKTYCKSGLAGCGIAQQRARF